MRPANFIDGKRIEPVHSRARRRVSAVPRTAGSASRVALTIARMSVRYPDDPVGDYETTSGVW